VRPIAPRANPRTVTIRDRERARGRERDTIVAGRERRRPASWAGRRVTDWWTDGEDDGAGAAPAALLALGFLGGLAVGAAAWSRLLETSSRQLFSRSAARRYWAVSYLGARPSVDTARLLRDYVRWEPHPLLRRRARHVLAEVEASLGR
jgi:hypothetical protein